MKLDIVRNFSFRRRPISIPGDLRISWRLAIIALMLGHSRAGKASMPKLHILNNAARSEKSHRHLDDIISTGTDKYPWVFNIEPAFSRAIDFFTGEGLAERTSSSDYISLKISQKGSNLLKNINEDKNILIKEKQIISNYSPKLTEAIIKNITHFRG